ncbi:MAG TPA: zinc-ribbon domain-containing protein, partial [Methylotenera sp.]|nr:zinc-ribbon domain-containing protein [Methylotenera sp.]
MSNITNCPNCQTQFVVSKKQLKQYQGKVRCGHCLHVFDATMHMVEAIPNEGIADATQEVLSVST